MCGILGAFTPGAVAPRLPVERLHHRGPDSTGEWRSPSGEVWFGHTRLAILDLSPAGYQPMVDPETGNVLIFNGEIYNHQEVRQALNLPESAWRGHSDTETLLVGYRIWGAAVLERLKGMFALAMYDARKNVLWLARDRLGIKPLYFRLEGRNLFFSSEAQVLLGDRPAVSREGVAQYLAWGACPDDNLIWEGLHALPAGAWMEFSAHGSRMAGQYWPPQQIVVRPALDAPRRVRKLLETAVDQHLLSDVPVACFLSGGIDSSVVTALAGQRLGRKLKTYAVGFPHTEYDESGIAEIVARRYGTDHHLLKITEENCVSAVDEALRAMDLPSVDAINTFIVAKAVAQHGVKVALSGLGADELFGGYPSFRDVPRLLWLARLPPPLRRRIGGLFGARVREVPGPDLVALAHWRRQFFTTRNIAALGLTEFEPSFMPCPGGMDAFGKISWAELTGYMRHMLLRDSDNMSMAVSLELRVPFLDHDLVEYVLALPNAEKRGYRRPKGLLIAACNDLLPTEVYNRPKMGFTLPMDRWMRGPLASTCMQGIEALLATNIFNEQPVREFERQFRQRKLHWTRWWSLVALGLYLARQASKPAQVSTAA